jgi:ABC-type multidrug transport system fused ATPase/permease subunit
VIGSVQKRLVDEVRKNDTLIIVGETGSGKTTRKFVSDFRFPPFFAIAVCIKLLLEACSFMLLIS